MRGHLPNLLSVVRLSLILLAQPPAENTKRFSKKTDTNYGNIILCLACLYIYAWVFEWLGFVPATFVFIALLIKFIGKKSWFLAILTGALTAILSYIFFGVWLRAALPRGIFGI